MKLTEPISRIMTRHLFTISVNESLIEAKYMFDRHKIRHLPVVDGKKLVGILSLTDIMRLSFGDTYGPPDYEVDESIYDLLTIDQVMNSNPQTVNSNDIIKDVVDIFLKEEFHALPVTDGQNLIGIVTTTDLIRNLIQKSTEVNRQTII